MFGYRVSISKEAFLSLHFCIYGGKNNLMGALVLKGRIENKHNKNTTWRIKLTNVTREM